MLELFSSPATPFGRKVAVALQEMGLADQVKVTLVSGNAVDPGTMPLDKNPLGKIPALTRPEGGPLYDSRVICRYLDSLAGVGLYPSGRALWDVLVLEALADGMTDAALLVVYEARIRPEPLQFGPWVEGQWAKVSRALDAVEAQWLPHLQGGLDMGQIALGCALGYLDLRLGARNWREGRPGLAHWYEGFAQRPAMKATAPV
jgi:glutathione S-transferase